MSEQRLEAGTTVAAQPSRNSLRFDSMLTAGAGVAVYALSGVTGPLLARNLGPAGRGDLASVLVPTEVVGWLLCFGIPFAAVYYSSRYSARQLVMASWTFAALVGSAVALAGWFAVPWYLRDHAPQTIPWFRAFLVGAIVFAPVQTVVELLTAQGRMVIYNVWRVFPLVVNSLFIVILAVIGHLTLTTALAAAFLANGLWFIGVILANRGWPGRGFRRHVFRSQLHYGVRVTAGSLSRLLVSRLDQFLLVGLVSARSLGFYVVAVTAVGFSAPLSEGIATALFPRLVHSAGQLGHERTFGQAVRWTVASSALASVGIGLLAPWVIPLLFGSAFDSALTPLWVLLPGQFAANVGIVVSFKLMADNRPGAASAGLIVAGVVTVAGLAIAIRPFGILGAAAVTTASQVALLAYVSVAVLRGTAGEPVGRLAAPS